MSLLGVLNLVGYCTGAALYFWLAALLFARRRRVGEKSNHLDRALLALTVTIGVWHASNLALTLHALLGLERATWDFALRAADTTAIASVTLCYSLLLHVHLHLWANARLRPLTRFDRARVYLSYLPLLFLPIVAPLLWAGDYQPMLSKLDGWVLPFALWSAYVLLLVAGTDFLIARVTSSKQERRLMRVMAASFVAVALLMLAVYAAGWASGTTLEPYLQLLANLGSLLPSALLAYYIYRYRYLELAIKESLVVASFAAVVMVVYLFGIRTFGDWLTERWGLNPGSVEALLILALALVAAPLKRWLDNRFHRLFERDAALYRDVVARVGVRSGERRPLGEMLADAERSINAALHFKRTTIFVDEKQSGGETIAGRDDWPAALMAESAAAGWATIDRHRELTVRGYDAAYPLAREGRGIGVMLIEGGETEFFSAEVRSVLEALAGQLAAVIEERRLIDENVQLERRLAQGERLAALGQMAATIAHEVRNPLSSIKSIAQVMGEDEKLRDGYGRDIDLIVGETDRLSRSVIQLLNFARQDGRTAPKEIVADDAAARETRVALHALVERAVDLCKSDAAQAKVEVVTYSSDGGDGGRDELTGEAAAAVRDALSNLLLNAIQATPPGGQVRLRVGRDEHKAPGRDVAVARIAIADGGAGVAPGLREKIWEPFFTTKQRGTGLGLAIVRRRMEQIGGDARLAPQSNGSGATFELIVPLCE